MRYVRRKVVRVETARYGNPVMVLECGHTNVLHAPTRRYPEARTHREVQNCYECTKALTPEEYKALQEARG